MQGFSFEQISAFSHTWGVIYFFVIFGVATIYAFWPRNKARFERAASLPLHEDEEV